MKPLCSVGYRLWYRPALAISSFGFGPWEVVSPSLLLNGPNLRCTLQAPKSGEPSVDKVSLYGWQSRSTKRRIQPWVLTDRARRVLYTGGEDRPSRESRSINGKESKWETCIYINFTRNPDGAKSDEGPQIRRQISNIQALLVD